MSDGHPAGNSTRLRLARQERGFSSPGGRERPDLTLGSCGQCTAAF